MAAGVEVDDRRRAVAASRLERPSTSQAAFPTAAFACRGAHPLHRRALERRVRQDAGGIPLWVAPLEYVILRKLQWHREGGGGSSRHLEDIRGMLRVSGGNLDRTAMAPWISRLAVHAEWEMVAGEER